MARSEYLPTNALARSIDAKSSPRLDIKKTPRVTLPAPARSTLRACGLRNSRRTLTPRISRHNTDDGRRTESSRRRKQQRQSEKKALNPIAIAASIGQENSCARFPPHSLSRVENQPQRSSLAAGERAAGCGCGSAGCGFTLQYPRSPPSNHSVYRLQNPFFRPETERSFPSRRAVEGFG